MWFFQERYADGTGLIYDTGNLVVFWLGLAGIAYMKLVWWTDPITLLCGAALALGLASLSSSRTQVESLFIDEGFGSLDQDTLDLALASLDTLQSLGRKVGVISHVQAMVERIGAQVLVEKRGAGQSRVRVEVQA